MLDTDKDNRLILETRDNATSTDQRSCARNKFPKNLTGRKFGFLTVLGIDNERKGLSKAAQSYWKVQCDCGNITSVSRSNLTTGAQKSCGCRIGRIKPEEEMKESETRLYRIWLHICGVCSNPNAYGWKSYGGKGIKVYSAWAEDFMKFKKWAYEQGFKEDNGLSITRKNKNKNFNPQNCILAPIQQVRSMSPKRQDGAKATYNNVTKSVQEWARLLGIKRTTLLWRLEHNGWKLGKIVNTPIGTDKKVITKEMLRKAASSPDGADPLIISIYNQKTTGHCAVNNNNNFTTAATQ